MGQGGFYTLVNATPYTWFKTHQHSYQMNAWSFPDTVAPYTAINVYVEFDEGTGKHTGDDGGEVDFEDRLAIEGSRDLWVYLRVRRWRRCRR